MKLGIMQPYFFPYLGYFSLIKHTDKWVFFDTSQYIRKGWINRNRILKKGGGTKYIGLNVEKHPRETPINEIVIKDPSTIADNLIRNMDYYKDCRAPHYEETVEFIRQCVTGFSGKMLADFLIHSLQATCEHLKIQADSLRFSDMGNREAIESQVNGPDGWALLISDSLHATHYINPPGGRKIFDRHKFDDKGIRLSFLTNDLPSYDQGLGKHGFVEALSVIDALMFNSVDQVLELLDACTLDDP